MLEACAASDSSTAGSAPESHQAKTVVSIVQTPAKPTNARRRRMRHRQTTACNTAAGAPYLGAPISTSGNQVTVSIFWQPPRATVRNNYVSVAYING